MATRQKLILTGLYLSKFDSLGLRALGFESFVEAFNVVGYALGSRPASIKNYRDEFDPHFPNQRKGWRNRPTRDYCREVFEEYKGLGLEDFTSLIKSFFGVGQGDSAAFLPAEQLEPSASAFAQRLITGLAAERYFESRHSEIPEFRGYALENTTQFGCGYDFRLRKGPDQKDFLAVEVKGLKEQTGSLVMTSKEYDTASALRERFFLFVVRNFREAPAHQVFQDPLSSALHFKRTERTIVQVAWLTNL